MPGLYQLSYLALHWWSPYFVNIFVCGGGGGVPVKSHETIYCPLARDLAQVMIQHDNCNIVKKHDHYQGSEVDYQQVITTLLNIYLHTTTPNHRVIQDKVIQKTVKF